MVATIKVTISFSNLVASSKMLASSCTSNFVLLSGRTGSCGTIPLLGIGSYVYVFSPVFILFSSWRLFLLVAGSYVSTLGPITSLALYCLGNIGRDVFNEEVALVVSKILPLPLSF